MGNGCGDPIAAGRPGASRQVEEEVNAMRPIDRFLTLAGAEVAAAATGAARSAGLRVAELLLSLIHI